jgi:hypothetical protein
MRIVRALLRREARRAGREALAGRLWDRSRPDRGRLLAHEVDGILDRAWQLVDEMLPEARLERISSLGNRQNVLFAVLTVAAHRALREAGFEREYAMELVADVGWKVYGRVVALPRGIARLLTRDPQRRLEWVLRILLAYPFGRSGRPGYECEVGSEPGTFRTDWTFCPPYDFVRRYAEAHDDPDAVEVFRRSWCTYDWALTYAIVDDGQGVRGHYERPHTLSAGDALCDMRWSARAPRDEPRSAR